MKGFGNDKAHLCRAGKKKKEANGDDGLCPEGTNKKENLRLEKENKII